MQGAWVQSLVGELDPPRMPQLRIPIAATKKKKKKDPTCRNYKPSVLQLKSPRGARKIQCATTKSWYSQINEEIDILKKKKKHVDAAKTDLEGNALP